MLAVFRKDLRLFLRDRSALVFSLLMPIFVITVIAEGLFHGDGGPKLLIPVVNEDGGPVAGTFQKLLAEHADVREMSREEAERLVRDKHDAPAAIVFPAKLSKQYLQGRSSEILLLTDPASGSDLQAVKVLLLLMDKEAAALADPFAEEKITLTEQNLTGNRLAVTVFEQRVPGFALMFVLLAVVFGTSMSMHDERDWGTLARLLVAPGGFTRILLGKLAARFVVGVMQMLRAARLGPFRLRCLARLVADRLRAAHDGRRVRGGGRGDARGRSRTLARADLAARAVDGDGALRARRLLVAAVECSPTG